MYLSRLVLNPRSRAVRHDLADCHELHRTIMRAFPSEPGDNGSVRAQFGVLYRVESLREMPAVLVQSQENPNWSVLEVQDDNRPYLTDHKTGKLDNLW